MINSTIINGIKLHLLFYEIFGENGKGGFGTLRGLGIQNYNLL